MEYSIQITFREQWNDSRYVTLFGSSAFSAWFFHHVFKLVQSLEQPDSLMRPFLSTCRENGQSCTEYRLCMFSHFLINTHKKRFERAEGKKIRQCKRRFLDGKYKKAQDRKNMTRHNIVEIVRFTQTDRGLENSHVRPSLD